MPRRPARHFPENRYRDPMIRALSSDNARTTARWNDCLPPLSLSNRRGGSSVQRAPHPSLGSQYWFTRTRNTRGAGPARTPGHRPSPLRVADLTSAHRQCAHPPPKYRCRGADNGNARPPLLRTVLRRAASFFSARFAPPNRGHVEVA